LVKLCYLLLAFSFFISLFTIHSPQFAYKMYRNKGAPLRIDSCEKDHTLKLSRATILGINAPISLCFPTAYVDEQMVVMYKYYKDGGYDFAPVQWPETIKAMKLQSEAFEIPDEDKKTIFYEIAANFFNSVGYFLAICVGSGFALYILSLAIGWIVRGFLNIEHGQDN